ncbi:MAG: anhydro-N-acetylmuramic acid kinase [Rhodospirillaceae bacterium]|jgi:anhydro-N-acetylmuramic acid kinase|nr:anhydro-N-acetylmuramic acid kinase [Rhodospirillaceae bacterium]MBT4587851.1 anhydro-N-acetylmuramic acid kinase [Rhodospirillaceae bacterium]MBT4939257.1 anhydro-N-acetylmuramic acid kinase [Rhodospirillaceae bacterium]MBT5939215.1 anhydro-N-acetylmuramic acid kinase [Rhodospirillaceae bacterium]MBT7267350.1 anhydro-N-acetylmuramic acid kinase [Rhodospirillaceae bacterium]
MSDAKIYTALGLMSGTSLDGIDAAIVKTDGKTIASFGPFESKQYEPDFRNRLRAELGAKSASPELEEALTGLHADLIAELLAKHSLTNLDIDVIGFHGQTLHHEPENHFTLQLGDGALLAKLVGCDVVNNFRGADVAAGGEGAPFAPVYHQALSQNFEGPIVIVNIGGVANVSFIDTDHLIAFDTGPGNAAIDDVVRTRSEAVFDEDGNLARQGRVDTGVLAGLLDHPYFDLVPPKSLDRNAFNFSAVDQLSLEDAAATLVAFTIETIARASQHFPLAAKRWLVTGGGRHNSFMMEELAKKIGQEVQPVERVGWNGDAIEAQAFAFMAVRSLLDLPLSFPSTTGVAQALSGGDLYRA